MPAPSKVEFPGKKRQRMRMRGTKQANVETQKRMRKNLDRLLEEGESLLPVMTWKGKLRWGRTDPVTKTLRDLRKIFSKRHDKKWLAKRMMAKSGDDVGKALAGSLMAAHDEDLSLVGDYSHQSFGKASYIRRGDGKVAYQAGLQNYSMPTLRMLPWEDHARRGYFFFSWRGGFVCSGPVADIPEGWLDDILGKSRFDFEKEENIWATEGLDFEKVASKEMSGEGYLLLNFVDGSKVAIGFDKLQTVKGKSSFIHDLALSMLPPNLSTVMDPEAIWHPEGSTHEGSNEALGRILDAWMGLTLNEGSIAKRVKVTVLHHIDEGFVVGEKWFANAEEAVLELNGSSAEKELALKLMVSAAGSGVRISQRGEVHERDGSALEISANSCNDVLSALWEDHGLSGLIEIGIEEDEAEDLWSAQCNKKRAFGKFLKDIESQRAKADIIQKFPYRRGKVPGPVGMIHDLTVMGLVEGMGKAEKSALSKKDGIDQQASSWAWLVAAGKSNGQEWQFTSDARDRGGVWSAAAIQVWNTGKALVNGEDVDYKSALEALRKACGQIEELP
ncbi:MAG: hypothetical protein DWC02_07785 [Candidatus Poseidoniales archaeon]|nr:MAG: hypothetical protein DWC02_07785 [Candidatus Poseidoniales archaeon]